MFKNKKTLDVFCGFDFICYSLFYIAYNYTALLKLQKNSSFYSESKTYKYNIRNIIYY